jgi:ssDNA-binding Zn-finger/Zn-ribbon topoisomerase 1
MSVSAPCPKCGEYSLHKSRSKNIIEKGIKKIIFLRTYRCGSCKWRGWMSKHRAQGNTPIRRIILFYAGLIILAFFIAFGLTSILD